MTLFDLSSRVSLVTGAARGIGFAMGHALAGAGSAVAIVDLDLAQSQAAAELIARETGRKAKGYECDVRDAARVKRVIDEAADDFGQLDCLINNAGVQFVAPIAEFPEDKWEFVRAIDLDSVFFATKAAWPHLVARGGGRIVNIASVHGLVASPFKPAYIAAKHGVVGLTKASALEGAAVGITVNAICPGAVLTDIVRGQAADLVKSYGGNISEDEALDRAFLQSMPTRRFIEPGEIGALCVFLCSESAKSITGASIPIDGGWSAR